MTVHKSYRTNNPPKQAKTRMTPGMVLRRERDAKKRRRDASKDNPD